ncbi:MAG: hypothetical protein NTV80_19710 [Verrucomicrobia bacterium]|nr:hypothetical protein [Verrucomicrobiota bacterium]
MQKETNPSAECWESGERLRVCRSAAFPLSNTSGGPVSLEMRCGM